MGQSRREIAARFREAIESGMYPPGSTLPRAADIAAEEGVSKGLVQDAYGDLRAEGLVDTVRRRGTVVLDRRREKITRSRLVMRDELGYSFDAASLEWRLLEHYGIHRVPVPLDVADLLGLSPGSEVIMRDRLLGLPVNRAVGRTKPEPTQLATSYLPAWLVNQLPKLEARYTGPGGVLDRIEEAMGGPLIWEEYIGSENAGPVYAERLKVPSGTSLLRVYCVTRLPDERPVEVTIRTFSAARYRIGPHPLIRHSSAAFPPVPATEPKPPKEEAV
ncbi:GntR family transcriptional regulator [Lentzea chajnantorensis]